MSKTSLPAILTVKEVAQYLRVTVDELNIELTNGHIPALKIAGTWRIKRDVLDKLLESSIIDSKNNKDEFVVAKTLSESQLEKAEAFSDEMTTFPEKTEIIEDLPTVNHVKDDKDKLVTTESLSESHSEGEEVVTYPYKSGNAESQKLYEKAALAKTEGRIEEARRFFKQSIESYANPTVYTAYIKMEQEKKNKESATKLLQEAIEKFPEHANFYLMYGHMERRAKNFELAKNILQQGLEQCSQDVNLRWGLGQTLVQIGTEESLQEANKIFQVLDQQGKLNKGDGIYQRFKMMHSDPRAAKTYQFFKKIPNMSCGFAGQRHLPSSINNATLIIAEINHPELKESFGLEGAFLVQSFKRQPRYVDIVNLNEYMNSLSSRSIINSQEGRKFVINPSLAFIVVPDSDTVRDSVMRIVEERAIIPLDDTIIENDKNPFDTLRDLLGQYIGLRDLYSSTLPVSGRKFFGREKWLVQLSDLVQQGQFFGIYGLRKMGKTSLIYQFRDERLRGEAVAYVDLQASPALTEKNCAPIYWELEHDLYNRLFKHDKAASNLLRLGKVKRFSDLPDRATNVGLMFNEDLRALLDAMSAGKTQFKKLIIVLDELERILPIAGQEGVQGYLEFFGLLRGLSQTERYRGFLSSIVVAANSALSERGYWEGKENPVFALYKPHFLSPLSKDDCVEMIRTLGKGMSVYWEDDAIATVFTETNGHPFITRLLCSRIAKRHSERPLTVTVDKVQEEVPGFIRDEGHKLEQITELLDSHFPDEAELLEQIALDETPNELQDSALSHLLSYQLISSEHGQYQISFNLLQRWLRRRAGLKE